MHATRATQLNTFNMLECCRLPSLAGCSCLRLGWKRFETIVIKRNNYRDCLWIIIVYKWIAWNKPMLAAGRCLQVAIIDAQLLLLLKLLPLPSLPPAAAPLLLLPPAAAPLRLLPLRLPHCCCYPCCCPAAVVTPCCCSAAVVTPAATLLLLLLLLPHICCCFARRSLIAACCL